MSGFDCLGADDVGIDYMSMLKGGAGLLSGAGSAMSKGGDDKDKDKDKKKLEELERSAARMRTGLIVGGTLGGAGLIAWLVARR